MKNLIIAFFFLFTASYLYPQSITGTFTGKLTGYLNTGGSRENYEVHGEATLTIGDDDEVTLKYNYQTNEVNISPSPKYPNTGYKTGEATLTGRSKDFEKGIH